jgi:hypothetical protein
VLKPKSPRRAAERRFIEIAIVSTGSGTVRSHTGNAEKMGSQAGARLSSASVRMTEIHIS